MAEEDPVNVCVSEGPESYMDAFWRFAEAAAELIPADDALLLENRVEHQEKVQIDR